MDFGELIKQARADKGYSQKELSRLLGVNFSYLSKLENNKLDYPAKEEIIRGLAHYLGLDKDELTLLAGRIPQRDREWMKAHYKEMSVLLRKMRENPQFAQEIFQVMTKDEG